MMLASVRESMAMEVGQSMGSAEVIAVLDRLGRMRRRPRTISVDNGPEVTFRILRTFAEAALPREGGVV